MFSACKLYLNKSNVKKQTHLYATELKSSVTQLSVVKLSFHYQNTIENNEGNDCVGNLAEFPFVHSKYFENNQQPTIKGFAIPSGELLNIFIIRIYENLARLILF